MKKLTIVGAGLTGSLLAITLAKKGFFVDVYEKRPDMRKAAMSAGRSINLAISVRGIHALAEVGIANQIMKNAIPMFGRKIHDMTGEISYQAYGRDDSEHINSISRGDLNKDLISHAETFEQVNFYFNHELTAIDFTNETATFFNHEANKEIKVTASPIIGTDGGPSMIRTAMIDQGYAEYETNELEHSYKELTIPPELGSSLEKQYLHIWPRKDFMLIALPNPDNSFTCTLFLPQHGPESYENLVDEQSVTEFFNKYFSDAVPLMPTLLKDFFANPTSPLMTLKGAPWFVEDKAALMGDACHAIVPFFGQGMNAGFEDISIFSACLDQHVDDWEAVFSAYQEARKVNTDAIADMSLQNYFEMRDHVGDSKFLLRKQIEKLLMQKYPNKYC